MAARGCAGDIPDDPSREGYDGAVGDDQVDRAYENLGRVYDYYHDTFGWDSYDGHGAPVIGVVNYCDGGVGDV
jgi:Zn-dependent metalloprotease